MSLLTDREIEQLSEGIAIDDFNHDLARRVEAAVLQKLATVSVAPVAWLDEEFDMAYTTSELAGEPTDPTMFPALYPPEAIAAARVQENEKIANWYYNEGHRLAVFEVAPAIRALITDKGQ